MGFHGALTHWSTGITFAASSWWGVARRRAGRFWFGGILLFHLLVMEPHPFVVEAVNQGDQVLPLAGQKDVLEAAIRLDLGVGDWDCGAHTSDRPAIIEIDEGLPDGVEVPIQNRLLRQRLGLDALFFLDLAQPVRLLGNRVLRPDEVGDQFPASSSVRSARNWSSSAAILTMRAKKRSIFGSSSRASAALGENLISLPSRSVRPFQPLMMFCE